MNGMDLADFLLARIAEDEAVANHARWAMQGEWFSTAEDKVDEFVRHNHPARALAECEAKRRIVGWFQTLSTMTDREQMETRHNELLHVLVALALPYADHPDYRQAWRP